MAVQRDATWRHGADLKTSLSSDQACNPAPVKPGRYCNRGSATRGECVRALYTARQSHESGAAPKPVALTPCGMEPSKVRLVIGLSRNKVAVPEGAAGSSFYGDFRPLSGGQCVLLPRMCRVRGGCWYGRVGVGLQGVPVVRCVRSGVRACFGFPDRHPAPFGVAGVPCPVPSPRGPTHTQTQQPTGMRSTHLIRFTGATVSEDGSRWSRTVLNVMAATHKPKRT